MRWYKGGRTGGCKGERAQGQEGERAGGQKGKAQGISPQLECGQPVIFLWSW